MKTLYLARRRPWKRFRTNNVIANAPILGQFASQVIQRVTNGLFRVSNLGLLEIFKVRHNNRRQFLGAGMRLASVLDADYCYLGNEWALQIVDLEVFGVNVLAIRKNDDVFGATDYIKMAVCVDLSQIA